MTTIEALKALREGKKITCEEFGANKYITTKICFGGIKRVVNEEGKFIKLDMLAFINDVVEFKIFNEVVKINKNESIERLLNNKKVYLVDLSEVKLGENQATILINNEVIDCSVIEFLNKSELYKII